MDPYGIVGHTSWPILALFGPPCFLSTGPMSSDLPFCTRELAFCEFAEWESTFSIPKDTVFFLEILAGQI